MASLSPQWRLNKQRMRPSRTCHARTPTLIQASTTTREPCPRIATTLQPHVLTPLPSLVDNHRHDPSLRSTWSHRAWVASGCTSLLVTIAKSMTAAAETGIWLEPLVAGALGYILADLGTGIYHWAIDNYGDASTPVFGAQIEAFQGHHRWPWTIARRQFANNLHVLARGLTFVLVPVDVVTNDAAALAFVGVCSGCIVFSQQFHAWAHSTKSRLPPAVVALQDAGVLVSRAKHAAHHRPPYNNNYCIVSGVWNEVLDRSKFFEAMEMAIFFRLGVRARSWSEPGSEWKEEGDGSSL